MNVLNGVSGMSCSYLQHRCGRVVLLLLSLAVAGCAGNNRPVAANYDFGEIAAAVTMAVQVGRVDVTAPVWLDTPAMQYRLTQEPARRQQFADSRWAASPAELLAVALRRQVANGGGNACRLRLELDELVQQFDAAGDSRVQLAVRARLLLPRGDATLASRSFQLQQDGGRDARSGVAAAARLQRQLAEAIGQWSGELRGVAAQCAA